MTAVRYLGAFAFATGLLGVSAGSTPPVPRAVRAMVYRTGESRSTRVILQLRIESTGLVLGSYSGGFHFDPALLVVDSAEAGRDGSRFVNAQRAAQGDIRFAGFSTTGFAGTDAVRLVAHLTKAIDPIPLDVVLDVAGDLEGRPVTRNSLRGTRRTTSAR